MTALKSSAPSRQDSAMHNTMPLREQIEERAYYLYLERGRSDGLALDDWLMAERELRERSQHLTAS